MVNRTPQSPQIVVTVESDDAAILRAGRDLAGRLGLAYVKRAKPQAAGIGEAWRLILNDERLELRDETTRPGRGLFVDFSTLHPKQAARRGGFSRQQPLAKAIGKNTETVLDATAGLGHDAALLACMGYRVIAVERSPIIAALLRDGLRRAEMDPDMSKALGERLVVISADAKQLISDLRFQIYDLTDDSDTNRQSEIVDLKSIDAVYIDPMFPPKRKTSALAKKSIRMVRALVGDDEDAGELLQEARKRIARVVVKRPTYAPPLAPRPSMSLTGKLVRYDVYLNR